MNGDVARRNGAAANPLAPDDLFFGEIVRSYTEGRHFLRRDWLARDLQGRLDTPGCRFVLLTAEPGAGKSAFIAQLAADHPDWPRFFIRRDQRTSLGETGARAFLLRTGFQLAAIHPELFALDQVRIEVEQQFEQTGADSEVVGARIKRIRASLFHQTVIRIHQHIGEAGGSVAGLQVDEWINDPRLIESEDLQQMALYAPARSLRRIDPAARIVILVDALDELRFGEPGHNLVDWLADCPPLPDNVRIVLTSRPSRGALETFSERRRAELASLPLEAADGRVQDDLRTYAGRLIEPPAIAAALQRSGRTPAAFVSELVARADGNIGYAAALGRAFDLAVADPQRQTLLHELLALEHLPEDIRSLFAFFLQLIRGRPGRQSLQVTDPLSGRAGLLEAWPALYQPVLALLSVAVQPLTLDQIHALTATLADRPQLAQALGWLEQFLDRTREGYRLYHATFAEFLTSAETRANDATTGLWVDARREHRRIADTLQGAGELEALWQAAADALEQARRDYGRLHLVTHLYLGEDWDRLAAAIDDAGYTRGKLRFDRSGHLFVRDLDLALRATARPALAPAARQAQLPRLWRWKLLRCSLSSPAERLSGAGYRALTLAGQDQEAAELAGLIADAGDQALALAQVSAGLGGQPAQAAALACHACEAAARVEDPPSRALLLAHLLDLLRPLAAPGCPGRRALPSLLATLARGFADPAQRAQALADVVRWLHGAGDTAPALALRAEILALVDAAGQAAEAPRTLLVASRLDADLGDLDSAARIADRIDTPAARCSAWARLAVCQHAAGQHAAAEATRAQIESVCARAAPGADRARAEVLLASVHGGLQDREGARLRLDDALRQLAPSDGAHADPDALLAVARGLQQLGDAERLADTVQRARTAAIAEVDGTEHRPGHGYTFSVSAMQLALGLADLDACDAALDIARRMQYYERGGVLLSVVDSLVRSRQFEHAMAVADELRQSFDQGPVRISMRHSPADRYMDDVQALMNVCAGLAADGQWQAALDVAQQLPSSSARNDALAGVAVAQFGAGLVEAARTLVAQLMHDVRLGTVADDREPALEQAGLLLVRSRQWPQAGQAARAIGDMASRSRVLAALARAKIEADDFAAASADIDDIGSGVLRAECRLALAQRLSTTGGAAGWAAGPGAIVGLLHAARADALADADMVQCAQVLRAIALAHSELFTGAVDEARQTMVAAAEALNRAPRFRFVPTPWCDTAVAFAELGFWDLAMKIAGGLVTHNAFDGCSALRDLAGVATRAGNKAQARELLARALASAPQVPIPPQRDDLLISLAAEYARLGDLQEARQPALVASNPADAEVQIAIALLESGQVAGALALIDRLPPGAPDSALARLVRALLAAGEVGRGRRVAEGLTDLAQRAERLAAVARQLITLGGADEARQLIATVSELELPFHSPHAAAQFQETVVTVLAEAGDLAAASRFVEQRWRTARHRSDLLLLMPLAGPLVRQQPELAGAIQASVGWVEQTLLAA